MIKLPDTQLVLLSHAAQHATGSLVPLPATITAPREAVDKSITAMIKRGLVEEGDVLDADLAWRQDSEKRYGARITVAGRTAIGLDIAQPSTDIAQVPATAHDKKQSKAGLVVEMLQRDTGATIAELVEATGWLPHTTRAALTGLRKKGHAIVKGKRCDTTCYNIEDVA